MNQYSIQITKLQDAIIIQTVLSPLIGAWQINYEPGEFYYKFSFKSKLDLESVRRKLGELDELDITFLEQDY